MGRAKIAHLTSVHHVSDPRVFYKECVTLARRGYDVVLIAPHDQDEIRDGVRIHAVQPVRGRLRRLTRTVYRVYRAAVEEDCNVYHLHDPELIPVGLLLRARGKKVIYDVHEDYLSSVRQKSYLPRSLRSPIAILVGWAEVIATKAFEIVLAERYYRRRFPQGTLVLNYPLETKLRSAPREPSLPNGKVRLLYTGVVTEDRGALIHAGLVHLREDVEVYILGRCSPDLASRMREVAGGAQDRLHIALEGCHVPYERILEAYASGEWSAGLALFPSTPHYRDKELTKFFEYMAAEIPILCSNFPTWKRLVESVGCGLAVDPADTAKVKAALEHLVDNGPDVCGLGRRGQAAVAQRYNWATEAERLVGVYQSLLTPRSPRRSPAQSERVRRTSS